MAKRVRLDDNNPRDYELGAMCGDCYESVLVLPPKSVRDAMDDGDYEKVERLSEKFLEGHAFYCPKCQKENDCDEMEKL